MNPSSGSNFSLEIYIKKIYIAILQLFHITELHSLYRSPNVVRVIKYKRLLRWAGHVARVEEGRSAFKILTGKPTGKRPLGRSRHRLEGNISMDLKQIYINTRNWLIRLKIGIIGEPL